MLVNNKPTVQLDFQCKIIQELVRQLVAEREREVTKRRRELQPRDSQLN